MNREGLMHYANRIYGATDGLMRQVPPDKLGWRPAETNNWMTVGQLLAHLTDSTGTGIKGFITGQWPGMSKSEMLPPARRFPSVSSVSEAREKLEADRKLTAQLLAGLSEEDFRNRMVTAPWNATPQPLCMQLLEMIEHQINHKAMLFAYLKLLGIPVSTRDLYGMG